MSKPVSNSDVEDVLSSIRRLVSDNKVKGVASGSPETPDRLVLSPHQRISDTDVLRLQPADAVHLPDLQDDNADASVSEVDPSALDPDDDATDQGLKPQASDAQMMPDNPQRDGEESATGRRLDVSELTAKIAALETAIAKTSDQWEPDGAGGDDYAGTEASGMVWPDRDELDAAHQPDESASAPAEEAGAPSPAGLSSVSDDQILDEEALRDLVAEIVRSELQGALGERITRNVRKLVRREIHRALAARDLD